MDQAQGYETHEPQKNDPLLRSMFLHSCKTNLRLFRRADEPSQITYSLKQSVVDSVAVVGELLQRTDSGIARGLREPHGEVRMSLAGFRVCVGCRV